MLDIKTEPSVLRSMRQAAERPASTEEIKQQPVSFVLSSFNRGSMTRVRVEEALAEQSGGV